MYLVLLQRNMKTYKNQQKVIHIKEQRRLFAVYDVKNMKWISEILQR